MLQDDFFVSNPDGSEKRLDRSILERMCRGRLSDYLPIDQAEAIVTLVRDELVLVGTSGDPKTTNEDSLLLLRACHLACQRVDVSLQLPFRDFEGFRRHWRANGMSGAWALRRAYVEEVFEPVLTVLSQKAIAGHRSSLAEPAGSSRTSWENVDQEIGELRRKFDAAESDQDFSAIGHACVRILEHLADVVFDPFLHLAAGEDVPARDKTKIRFERFIVHELPGSDNDKLRGLARSVVEVSHAIKHRIAPSKRDAAIAADSVILLASMLRRISG